MSNNLAVKQKIRKVFHSAIKGIYQECSIYLSKTDEPDSDNDDGSLSSTEINELIDNSKMDEEFDKEQEPKFKPKKIQKAPKKVKEEKEEVITEKPKQPMTPYFLFVKEKRSTVKKEYPHLKPGEMANILAEVWNELTEKERSPFVHAYNRQHSEYLRKMNLYEKNKNRPIKNRSTKMTIEDEMSD